MLLLPLLLGQTNSVKQLHLAAVYVQGLLEVRPVGQSVFLDIQPCSACRANTCTNSNSIATAGGSGHIVGFVGNGSSYTTAFGAPTVPFDCSSRDFSVIIFDVSYSRVFIF